MMDALTKLMLENPAILISILALLFTVYSFWWMNWRRGKIHVGPPRSYAAFGSESSKAVLELPFIFFNSGPMPVFVQNLQILINEETSQRPFIFTATVDKLASDEGRKRATQFPVRGREALLMICEFQRVPGEIVFEQRSYPLVLQAKLGNRKKWRTVSHFSLLVSESSSQSINRQFIAHDNLEAD